MLDRNRINYIGNESFSEIATELNEQFPDMVAAFDPLRVSGAPLDEYIAHLNAISWEFETEKEGGRSASHNLAQTAYDNRRVGFLTLMACFSPNRDRIPGKDFRILDVLGGPGTIAEFFRREAYEAPNIYTADLSNAMISDCRAKGLPFVRQSAGYSLFRDGTFDGVLIAYGSQLLDVGTRAAAVAEAYRTLKQGGRLVFHAFEIGGKVEKFFNEVVHPYSRTGHPHPHFSRPELIEYFTAAGFRDVTMFDIDDPFHLYGDSETEARSRAILHVMNTYDLCKIPGDGEAAKDILGDLISNTLGPVTIKQDGHRVRAEIPRTVTVAVGVKTA